MTRPLLPEENLSPAVQESMHSQSAFVAAARERDQRNRYSEERREQLAQVPPNSALRQDSAVSSVS